MSVVPVNQDPDFKLYREILTGFMQSLELDVQCVFGWLFEGIDAGGELAFMTAMLACGDFDRGVHPRHIMNDLWQAYDQAQAQVARGLPAAEMRAARAAAVRPR